MKCSVFIAASVDGYIARSDGDIDWLHNPAYNLPGSEDFGYEAFTSTVDALVMGRKSFEKVLTFDSWAYGDMPVVVLSSRRLTVPAEIQDTVMTEGGEPDAVVARLAERGFKHLYVDGGVTIQRFLQAGLIDEMIVTQIPILLGEGLPLFGAIGVEVPLRLLDSASYENGFVQNHYEVLKPT